MLLESHCFSIEGDSREASHQLNPVLNQYDYIFPDNYVSEVILQKSRIRGVVQQDMIVKIDFQTIFRSSKCFFTEEHLTSTVARTINTYSRSINDFGEQSIAHLCLPLADFYVLEIVHGIETIDHLEAKIKLCRQSSQSLSSLFDPIILAMYDQWLIEKNMP